MEEADEATVAWEDKAIDAKTKLDWQVEEAKDLLGDNSTGRQGFS